MSEPLPPSPFNAPGPISQNPMPGEQEHIPSAEVQQVQNVAGNRFKKPGIGLGFEPKASPLRERRVTVEDVNVEDFLRSHQGKKKPLSAEQQEALNFQEEQRRRIELEVDEIELRGEPLFPILLEQPPPKTHASETPKPTTPPTPKVRESEAPPPATSLPPKVRASETPRPTTPPPETSAAPPVATGFKAVLARIANWVASGFSSVWAEWTTPNPLKNYRAQTIVEDSSAVLDMLKHNQPTQIKYDKRTMIIPESGKADFRRPVFPFEVEFANGRNITFDKEPKDDFSGIFNFYDKVNEQMQEIADDPTTSLEVQNAIKNYQYSDNVPWFQNLTYAHTQNAMAATSIFIKSINLEDAYAYTSSHPSSTITQFSKKEDINDVQKDISIRIDNKNLISRFTIITEVKRIIGNKTVSEFIVSTMEQVIPLTALCKPSNDITIKDCEGGRITTTHSKLLKTPKEAILEFEKRTSDKQVTEVESRSGLKGAWKNLRSKMPKIFQELEADKPKQAASVPFGAPGSFNRSIVRGGGIHCTIQQEGNPAYKQPVYNPSLVPSEKRDAVGKAWTQRRSAEIEQQVVKHESDKAWLEPIKDLISPDAFLDSLATSAQGKIDKVLYGDSASPRLLKAELRDDKYPPIEFTIHREPSPDGPIVRVDFAMNNVVLDLRKEDGSIVVPSLLTSSMQGQIALQDGKLTIQNVNIEHQSPFKKPPLRDRVTKGKKGPDTTVGQKAIAQGPSVESKRRTSATPQASAIRATKPEPTIASLTVTIVASDAMQSAGTAIASAAPNKAEPLPFLGLSQQMSLSPLPQQPSAKKVTQVATAPLNAAGTERKRVTSQARTLTTPPPIPFTASGTGNASKTLTPSQQFRTSRAISESNSQITAASKPIGKTAAAPAKYKHKTRKQLARDMKKQSQTMSAPKISGKAVAVSQSPIKAPNHVRDELTDPSITQMLTIKLEAQTSSSMTAQIRASHPGIKDLTRLWNQSLTISFEGGPTHSAQNLTNDQAFQYLVDVQKDTGIASATLNKQADTKEADSKEGIVNAPAWLSNTLFLFSQAGWRTTMDTLLDVEKNIYPTMPTTQELTRENEKRTLRDVQCQFTKTHLKMTSYGLFKLQQPPSTEAPYIVAKVERSIPLEMISASPEELVKMQQDNPKLLEEWLSKSSHKTTFSPPIYDQTKALNLLDEWRKPAGKNDTNRA